MKTHAEKIQAHVMAGAALAHARNLSEGIDAGGLYTVSSWRPVPARLDEYIALRDTLAFAVLKSSRLYLGQSSGAAWDLMPEVLAL